MHSQVDISNYEIIEKVGKGSFGEVFKVNDKSTGKTYAAKVSFSSIDELVEEEKLDYLLLEINIISKLEHPSILKYIGYSINDFKSKKRPCIITEFLSNGTLKDIIELERKGLITHEWDNTRKLINIYGIAAAMSFLHSHEIIHRDLKPENILMDESLSPKISDFGLSMINNYNPENSTSKSTTDFVGTMCYMAPEIWRDSVYSKKSDVYAFSIILYEIFTNDEPYYGCTQFDIMDRIDKCKRPELKGVQSPYRELIEICWDENPANRPSFDQIVQMLKKDAGFITELVDEGFFEDYIDYIDNSQKTFDFNSSMIKIDKYKLSGNFQKILQNEMLVEKQKQEVEEEEEKNENETFNDDDLPFDFPPNENNDPSIEKSRNLLRKKLKQSSTKSIPKIVYQYANMMKIGKVFPINMKEAVLFYKISADLGYSKAMTQYGIQLIKGVMVDVDFHQAIKYFKSAIEKGDHDAMNLYADLLNEGKIIKQNYEKALTYYKMAAEKGNIPALYNIGMMYFEGKGVKINYKKAIHYFEKAAENGNSNSYDILATIYLKGKGVDVDFKKGFKYEKLSADLGNADAMYNIGVMYDNGTGVDVNYEKALEYYNSAANKNHAIAINNIGVMYLNGNGVDANQKEAFNYFQKAANKGSFEAMRNLGNLYRQGIGCNLSIKKAFEWFKRAVGAGDKESTLCINSLLDSEKSTKKLRNEMIEYLHQNAKSDNEFAMSSYGYLLLTGELVPQDIKKSCFYFKKAADRGVVSAMVVYANLMKSGVKGEPNLELAFEYYKMAAENDNPEAIYNLGILYKILYSNAKKSQFYLKKAEDLGYEPPKNEEEDNEDDDHRKPKNQKDIDNRKPKNQKDIDNRRPKNEEDVDYRKPKNKKDVDNRKPKNEEDVYNRTPKNKKDVDYRKPKNEKDADYQKSKNEEDIDHRKEKNEKDVDNRKPKKEKESKDVTDKQTKKKELKIEEIKSMKDFLNFIQVAQKGLISTEDLERSFLFFKKSADSRNVDSMVFVGMMYEGGLGTTLDYEKALFYYNRAAKFDNPVALNNIGSMYLAGEGIPVNYKNALKYYRMSADGGYSVAFRNLGIMYQTGKGVEINLERAVKYYKKAFGLGENVCIEFIGSILHSGQLTKELEAELIEFIHKKADSGDSSAMYLYGTLFAIGQIVPKDPEKAIHYIKLSVDNDNPKAAILYGNILRNEKNDPKEAFKYYRKAYESGIADGMIKIGELLTLKEIRIDNDAIDFIEKSAFYGEIEALKVYRYLVLNDKRLLNKLKNEADEGNIVAMRTFGYCVKDNDKNVSKRYLKNAADNGDKLAKTFFDELK